MKKSKWLLTIPAFTAPATVALCQCSKPVEEGIFLEETISSKFSLEIDEDSKKNKICDVQLLPELVQKNKIESVKVTFNGQDLKEDEYKLEFDSEEEGKFRVTIYSTTLETKKGRYVIFPVVKAKEFNGIIAELERKTYHVGDKVTMSNITVYQSLEGTQGDVIDWSQNIKVYENDAEITDFKTNGITLESTSSRTLKIVYNDFAAYVKVNVSKKEYTITCSIDADECGTLSASSFVAQEGDKWGPLAKPTFKPKEDVDYTNLTWDWYDTNDTLIPGDTVINSAFAAKMKVDFDNNTPETASKTIDTFYDNWGFKTYVPAENVEGTGASQKIKSTEYELDTVYTITMTVPNDVNIKYFWLANMDQYKAADCVYLYKRNILSVKVDGSAATYTIKDNMKESAKNGSYIELNTAATSGQAIEIQIRMLKELPCVPAFQVAE